MVGIDVSKSELVVSSEAGLRSYPNTPTGIARFLKTLKSGSELALEATGTYHLLLADTAFSAGFVVYVLNPKDVARYKAAVAPRGKTDRLDAEAIARFAHREKDSLHTYRPLPEPLRRLRALLSRRAKLVEAKVKVRQSLSSVPELQSELKAIVARIDLTIGRLESLIECFVASSDLATRLRQIPGVGLLTSATLTAALERGEFRRADSFVSFLGLDPLPHDSGRYRGRRRLSKMGDAAARKLAYTAAMAAARTQAFKPIYQRLRARLSTTEALVALSRRLVRTAWSLHKHNTHFQIQRANT